MSAADLVFDHQTLLNIETILRSCSIHRANISFRSKNPDTDSTKTEGQRILAWETQAGDSQIRLVSQPIDTLFHVASITKILVGTAITHAIEVKSRETCADNPWVKFKGIAGTPIRDVYNKHRNPSDQEMGVMLGNPTVYEFLVHSLGLPSCNDHLLAPDGTPLMDMQSSLDYIRGLAQSARPRDGSRWTSYSNLNFTVIALMIESCWNGGFADFMDKTLFAPLEMHSTSIGLPSKRTKASERWTVDQHGVRRPVQISDYKATGAEAAALGAYSTARDLDQFFSAIIDAANRIEPTAMQGFSLTINILLGMENKYISEVKHFTPFGLITKLSGSTIGSMSTSGLQFPSAPFTTYAAVPSPSGEEYSIHYMAGSAVGCSCATALRVDTTRDFAVTVLTDTSGPVAVADHILRLILQKWVKSQSTGPLSRLFSLKRDNVIRMVKQGKQHAVENWKKKEQEEQHLRQQAHPEPFIVQGTFNGVGITQNLQVMRMSGGKLQCAVSSGIRAGGRDAQTSGYFELLWKTDSQLWLCVPPHASIDRLDHGDWSNLLFEIYHDASGTMVLKRKRADGTEVLYLRQT